MFKKITALLLSGVLMAGMTTAFAETAATVQTASVTRELSAKATEWNGKTTLKAGSSYVVSKNLTVSKKVTLPKGATLTVKNNAKLTVGTKGTLNIKGTLSVAKGASVALSGKLYEYKTGRMQVSGTVSLGKQSSITINGQLTINSAGTIKGTPKGLKLADVAVVTITGKNSCSKLTKAIEQQEIGALLTDFFTLSFKDGDFYGAVKRAYPAEYVQLLDSLFNAEGLTLKEYCTKYGEALKVQYAEEGLDISTVTDVTVAINKLTALGASKLGSYSAIASGSAPDKGYTVNVKLTLKTKDGTKTDTSNVVCIKTGDKWYLVG